MQTKSVAQGRDGELCISALWTLADVAGGLSHGAAVTR